MADPSNPLEPLFMLLDPMRGIDMPPPEKLMNDGRTDVYLCYRCTAALSMPTVERRIFHPYVEAPDGHHAFYGVNLTVGQQVIIYEWEEKMQASTTHESRRFLDKRSFEDHLGFRDPNVLPASIIALRQGGLDPTFENISIRTDMCDYPQFPEEVRDWAIQNRFTYPISNEILDLVHEPYGFTFRDTLSQTEILMFTMYLQSKCLGAGSQFFTGRLREGIQFKTEEELEAYYDE